MVEKKELHREQEMIRNDLEAVGKKKGTESKNKLKGIIFTPRGVSKFSRYLKGKLSTAEAGSIQYTGHGSQGRSQTIPGIMVEYWGEL